MLGLLLQWIILKYFADLAHTHIACRWVNTPTVAWATKLPASKAKRAAQLLWILVLCMLVCQASPLTTVQVAGTSNCMADFASRLFQKFLDTQISSPNFIYSFPSHRMAPGLHSISQQNIWASLLAVVNSNTLKLQGSVTGGTGRTSFQPVSICTFRTWMIQNKSWSSKLLLNGSRKECLDVGNRSKLVASRQPLASLPRPLNWLAAPTLSTDQEQPTTMQQ